MNIFNKQYDFFNANASFLEKTFENNNPFDNFQEDNYESINDISTNIKNIGGICVLSLNIGSLPSKFEELKVLIDSFLKKDTEIHVVCLQEIWGINECNKNLFKLKIMSLNS